MLTRGAWIVILLLSSAFVGVADLPATAADPTLSAEFIYDAPPPTPSCHASTLAQTPASLVAAWFGGSAEGKPDVSIWLSRQRGGKWSAPIEVASGVQDDQTRFPCWNPVLFQAPAPGPLLLLFYKVGPSPSRWWGMLITSTDEGQTWSKPRRLPDGILGPIKDKPVLLADETLLCGSSTEDHGWRLDMEWTKDWGQTWQKTDALNDGVTWSAIQPTILDHGENGGGIQILCRTRQQRIAESWSRDGGRTWTPLAAIAALPNPNSGIDAVQLKDGRSLVVYNHAMRGRSPLNVAVSGDGKVWKAAAVLEQEPGEYSYPAVIQTADGQVHITYTWKRQRIKHVVIDPAKIEPKDLPHADGGAANQ
jgi:predicted neuraminidase